MVVSKRAVLFFGHSENGNVSRMLRGLKRGLEDLGVGTTEVDMSQKDYGVGLRAAVDRGAADFFLGMTGIGLDLRDEGNIFNGFGKPFVSVYLDPLLLYVEQIQTPIVRRIITTTSDGDVAIAPLPHAAETTEPQPWPERDIALLYPATGCDDPEAARRTEWPRYGAGVEAALNAIVEEHAGHPLQPLSQSIRTTVGGAIDMANPFAVYPYFSCVDRYFRGAVRWRALAGLTGLPLTVVGPGWEAFRRRFPDSGFDFVGPRAADDVQAMIRRSRVVVNTCTGYHGSHERVLDAQAAGAVAVSTETGWFRRTVPDDAIVYLDGEGGATADRLRAFLARPGDMAETARCGHLWQAGNHTWRHRAETLLHLLDSRA